MNGKWKKLVIALLALEVILSFAACGEDETMGVSNTLNDTPSEDLAFMLNEDGKSYSVSGIGTCTDTEVLIPETYNSMPVTDIGAKAFSQGRSFLKNITIPDSVTSIGDSAFERCWFLTSITIPDSVTSIGEWAFYNCSRLTSIEIPNGVTSIADYAFKDCNSLTSVVIPDGVTSIGDSAFENCSSLTSINIPDSVTSIGDSAFKDCSSLTSIEIPNGVTSVAYGTFWHCSSLTSIVVPDSVLCIDACAFRDTAYYNDDANWKNGVLYIGNHLIEAKFDRVIRTYTIRAGTKCIAAAAFFECSSLINIEIPDSVTGIGYDAFRQTAYYNDDANWENDVLYIGNHLIDAKSDRVIGTYNIREGTKCIPSDVFRGCSRLTSVVIPDSVTHIDSQAFYGCSNLTSIEIPNGVTSIGRSAFSNCSSLTSVVIPDGVTSVAYATFSHCSSLISVEIPDGVTSIGKHAFFYCSSLTSITIPDGVTSIGKSAFSNCSSLTSIEIPNGVTSIDRGAFSDCISLTEITYEGTMEQWNAIDKGMDWDNNTGSYVIRCTNGIISK